ncbi:hypothetical protein STCU_09907 [Strigomonas culicis]|uniref:Uncharacterized protein n=1 Tax=Strigomonas culicis TaxID=28005 RepID=S9TP15_9TRYP|nr:hypothetical protein STCU_09907 [Strigomonas culicis]|eukprot:EPY18444.1 hypothetical protein STCU_09907 [Strigomonas culicis]
MMDCAFSPVNFTPCTFTPLDERKAEEQQQQVDSRTCTTITHDVGENEADEDAWEMSSISSFYDEAQYNALYAQHRYIISHESDTFSQQVPAAPNRELLPLTGPSPASITMRHMEDQTSVHINKDNRGRCALLDSSHMEREADPVVVLLKDTEEIGDSCYLCVFGRLKTVTTCV